MLIVDSRFTLPQYGWLVVFNKASPVAIRGIRMVQKGSRHLLPVQYT